MVIFNAIEFFLFLLGFNKVSHLLPVA
jgi:hypothetical protein